MTTLQKLTFFSPRELVSRERAHPSQRRMDAKGAEQWKLEFPGLEMNFLRGASLRREEAREAGGQRVRGPGASGIAFVVGRRKN